MRTFSPLLLLALGCAAGTGAHAGSWQFVTGLYGTEGGDDAATVVFTNKSRQHVRTAELGEIHVGAAYQFHNAPWAVQMTLGYQRSTTRSDQGSVYALLYPYAGKGVVANVTASFKHYPLDALVLAQVAPAWRLGAGLRRSFDPSVNTALSGSSVGDFHFHAQTGYVAQGEWLLYPSCSLVLRRVWEQYTYTGTNSTVTLSGNSWGVGMDFRF